MEQKGRGKGNWLVAEDEDQEKSSVVLPGTVGAESA
jgi:hypothetical protein